MNNYNELRNKPTINGKELIGDVNVNVLEHYSTDEHIVGTWIDGSIIYQRTFVFSNPVNVKDSWVNTNIDSTDIDKIIRVVAYHSDGTCYTDICADPTRNNHTVLGLEGYSQGTVSILVLEYTKVIV